MLCKKIRESGFNEFFLQMKKNATGHVAIY